MDIVDPAQTNLSSPLGAFAPEPPSQPIRPPLLDQFVANFGEQNEIVSLFNRRTSGVSNHVEEGYNPWDDIKGTPYEQYWDSFARANNPSYAAAMKAQIDFEKQRKQIADNSGLVGTLGAILGGFASPTTFLPGGGVLRASKGGYSLISSALSIGAAAAAATGVQEAALQSLQELRTPEDSAIAIASGFVLGGVFGTGVAALLNRSDAVLAERGIRQLFEMAEPKAFTLDGLPKGLGAEAVDTVRYSRGDLSVVGRLSSTIVDMVHDAVPSTRMQTNASPRVRQAGQMLAENPFLQDIHLRNESLGAAAETEVRWEVAAQLGKAVTESDAAYKEMKKAGIKMSHADFEDAVGVAMRRLDQGQASNVAANPYIERAAKAYRDHIAEYFFQRGLATRDHNGQPIFPIDVPKLGALSYFTRLYQGRKMIAEEFQFKDAIKPYANKMVKDAYEAQRAKTNERAKAYRTEADELGLEGQARVDALADIEAARSHIEGQYAEALGAREDAATLRKAAREAREAGDVAQATRHEALAAELLAPHKEALKEAAAALRPLERSRRNIEQGVGAQAERADKIRGQLIDVEEGNIKTLQRLIAKGRQVERDLAKLDPADADARVAEFRTQFETLGRAFDKNVEQTKALVTQMEEELAKRAEERAALAASPDKSNLDKIKKMNEFDQNEAPKLKALKEKLGKLEAAQAERSQRMNRVAARLEDAEGSDVIELQQAVREAADSLVAEVSNTLSKRSERIARLVDRLGETDPALVKAAQEAKLARAKAVEDRFYRKWEGVNAELGEGGKPKLDAVAQDLVDSFFEKVSGRDRFGEHAGIPDYASPITRGPMKGRVTWFPEEAVEPWLENNARRVMTHYAKTVAGDISLVKKMGSTTLEPQVRQIKEDFSQMRAAVNAAQDIAELKEITGKGFDGWIKSPDLQSAKGNALLWLDKQEKEGLTDLLSLRDIHRRMYKPENQSSAWGQVLRAGSTASYILKSGGFGITSLNDVFMPAFRDGLKPFMMDGVLPLIRGLEGAKILKEEGKLAGVSLERILHHRLLSLMEVGDKFAIGTPAERFLSNMANVASRFNGLNITQDVGETLMSLMSQTRIMKEILGGTGGEHLALLGLGDNMAEKRWVKEQLEKYSEVKDGIRVPNTEKWDNDDAVRAYRAAVSKAVTSTVVRPGIADKPLVMHTPLGAAIGQFQSFQISSIQRIMIGALQEGQAKFISGMVGMTGLGIGIAYLKALGTGKENYEKFKEKAKNPAWLIQEGLDASGVLPLMFTLSHQAGQLGKVAGVESDFMKAGSRVLGGGTWNDDKPISSYGNDFMRQFGGPVLGLPTEALHGVGMGVKALTGKDLTDAEKKSLQYMIPGGTFIGIRDMLQALRGDHILQR